ncbi:MAG: site-specific DNA-methyltransferase [Candidatus Gracilibacteria bacterium]|nr:site-specific DNA-methyltransferase [Candidatus Gracilibacteria bacterium]MDD2909141.1 site-specific DNA-methyltransferase [Candidatus Gracilibacteria bacterium]
MSTQKLQLTWIGKDRRIKLEPRILIEDKDKSYGDPDSENMLIHGDNLLALKALEQDYTGKIKCIIIDPPYNTGNAFEHYDDGVEHSEWLNLIRPRLELLNKLLTDDGIIWISIDDNESHYLRILCDEIFGRSNFLACLPTIMNLKGNQDQFGFAGTHEYTIVFAKNKNKCSLFEFSIDDEELEEWNIDDIGYFKKGATMRATGEEQYREDRPYMFYPILVKGNEIGTIEMNEHEKLYSKITKTFNDNILEELINKYSKLGYDVVLPKVDENNYGRWRWGFNRENINRLKFDAIAVKTKNGISLYKKQRPSIGDLPTKKPKSIFYKPEYSSGNGTSQIKKLFGTNNFPYPKPEELIKDMISLSTKKDDIILDSFLGSGTTCSVAHKMGRKWIGIELGNHAYTHCKIRIDKVINGEDKGGITESVGWNTGGGYKFYELGPSLLARDEHGRYIINPNMNGEMLTRALCKIENFKYMPKDGDLIKHGFSTEKDFLHVTTRMIDQETVERIASKILAEDESLLIMSKTIEKGLRLPPNIQVKKIPNEIFRKYEYAKDDYSLPILSETREKLIDLKILINDLPNNQTEIGD